MSKELNLKGNPKFAKAHPAGTPIVLVQPSIHEKYGTMTLVVPNHVNMALNIATYNLDKASEIFQKIMKDSPVQENGIRHIENSLDYMLYFNHIQMAVLSSYNAVDIFTIDHARALGVQHVKQKYGKNQGKKLEFEWIPLDERLKIYLPEMLKVESPKKGKIFSDFQVLKDQREQYVHPTGERLYNADKKNWDKSYFGLSLSGQCDKCVQVAKNIISYFYEKTGKTLPKYLSS